MTEKELLKQLESKLTSEYKDTLSVINQKIADYTKDFDKQNKLYQKKVKTGEISKKEYQKWYRDQVNTAKWCNKMTKELSEDMTKATVKSAEIINGYTADSFALGCIEGSKEIAKDTSFDLIDKKQAEVLLDENKKILPKASPKVKKDKRWNEKRIKSAVLQSAIKGESVAKLARRLEVVVGMGKTSAIRNARTMMTASHNLGRLEVGYEAIERGIDIQKKWLATFDDRTRDSHALLNGEVVEVDEEISNGLMFPADPDGDPSEVYNCRCTFRYVHEEPHAGMSKEEFDQKVEQVAEKKEAFKEANRELKKEKSVPEVDTSGAMKGVPRVQQETLQEVANNVNPDYATRKREYTENCANCVVATELRCRGYDVVARERDFSRASDIAAFFYDNREGHGSWTDSFSGMKYERLRIKRKAKALSTIADKMAEYGDNSRAVLFIQWDGKTVGHYISVVNINGKVTFLDSQNGAVGKDVENYLLSAAPSQTRIWRTDDKEVTDFARKVVKWNEQK